MARGRPAAWSGLLALPLVAAGVYVFHFQTRLSLFGTQSRAPPLAGLALVLFGLFVVGLGVYVQFVVAPEAPTLRPGERIVDDRDPAQRNALAQAFASFPVLGAGIYTLYFTELPYAYPIAGLALGLYLFSTGCYRYWQNTLTTYLLTNRRVLEEYRFLSLVRNEVPHDKVRGVEERRTVWDSLFGLGNVNVRAGATGDLTITVDGIYESAPFADEIRAQLDDHDGPAGGNDDRVDAGDGEQARDDGDAGDGTDDAGAETPDDDADSGDEAEAMAATSPGAADEATSGDATADRETGDDAAQADDSDAPDRPE